MALKSRRHKTQASIDLEFENLESSKEPVFVWNADRAPNDGDRTKRFWVHKNGAQLDVFLYDSIAKTWRGPVTWS